MFKFLDNILRRREQAATAETKRQLSDRETYLALVRRAAEKDNLTADEAVRMDELHRLFNPAVELSDVAAKLAQHPALVKDSKSLAKLEKSVEAQAKGIENHDGESARLIGELRQARKAERDRMETALDDSRRQVNAAVEADGNRREIEAQLWEYLGIADPSIADKKQAAQDEAEQAEHRRNRILVNNLTGVYRRASGEPDVDEKYNPLGYRAIVFEDVVRDGARTPRSEYRNLKFHPSPEQSNACFKSLVAAIAQNKPVRYIIKANFAYPFGAPSFPDQSMVLRFEQLLAQGNFNPDRFYIALMPCQDESELRGFLKELTKLRDEAKARKPGFVEAHRESFALNA